VLADHVGRDGRPCGLIGDILYSVGVTGFIYPIVGQWGWGPAAFHDFAGSTVVHSIGGAISLVGAIVLGRRLGRVFRRDGGGPPLPHNGTLGAVGGPGGALRRLRARRHTKRRSRRCIRT
jgi:ammonium transporter family